MQEKMEETLKQKLLNNEELTSEEVEKLVLEYEYDLIEGEDRRWSRTNETIIEIDGRYFSVEWEKGLTEYQENEYYSQVAVEVEKKERIITQTYWEKKEK